MLLLLIGTAIALLKFRERLVFVLESMWRGAVSLQFLRKRGAALGAAR